MAGVLVRCHGRHTPSSEVVTAVWARALLATSNRSGAKRARPPSTAVFGQDQGAVLVANLEGASLSNADQRRDHVVGFFDDLPDMPEPPEDEPVEMTMPEWMSPPAQVMGAIVPLGQTVLRTEHVFVGLHSVTAHHSGISFDMVVSLRRGEITRRDWAQMEGTVWGSSWTAGVGATDPDALRWGVELADGQRTSTSEHVDWRPDVVREPPVLFSLGGSSTGDSHTIDAGVQLWLWPMPEGESLSLVVQWPALEVAATTRRVDLEPVRAVVDKVQPYWP